MATLEQKVMASVGSIYVARQLLSATALKLYVLVAALWALGRLVWVERVFENFTHGGVGNALNFVASALVNTEVAVQITMALMVVAGVWFVRDMAQVGTPRYR